MSKQPEALRLADELGVSAQADFYRVCDAAADELRRLHASNTELLQALHDLLEAVESMQGTYGEIRGDTPEDADTFTHDKWAEEFLQERANAALAVIAKVAA